MVAALPYNSLPLSFSVLPALSTAFNTVSVVSVNLPLQNAPQTEFDGTAAPCIKIVRILDPEHGEPFISIARVWACCGISPVQGLIRFDLRKPAYDSILAGVVPFQDIWIPLRVARTIAEELGRADELAGLLEWETRTAWSIEDKENGGGMIHNWKVSSDRIAPDEYSFEKLISTPFPRISLLPNGIQIRTLTTIPPHPPPVSAINLSPANYDQLFKKVVEWSIFEHERYLDLLDDASDTDDPPPTRPPTDKPNGFLSREQDLIFSNIFTTLLSLLNLDGSIPPSNLLSPPGSACQITDEFIIERKDVLNFGDSISMGRGRVGLVHAMGLLVSGAWSRELEGIARSKLDIIVKSINTKREDAIAKIAAEKEKQKEWEGIVSRLAALEDSSKTNSTEKFARPDYFEDISLLNRHISTLRFKLDAVEDSLASEPTPRIYPTSSPKSSRISAVFMGGLMGIVVGEVMRRVGWRDLWRFLCSSSSLKN